MIVCVARLRVLRLKRLFACDVKIGRVGFPGEQEVLDVAEPVLDRAEIRAVAPALADVEGRLAIVAALRIELAQGGQVVEPALLGAGTDVEVDALDCLESADGIVAPLWEVVDGVLLNRARLQPAFAFASRLAPALRSGGGRAGARGHRP